MHVKFGDKTRETTALKSYYVYKKKHLEWLISNHKHHLLTVYLKKIRLLRSKTLWNINMPSLLESP